MNGVRPIGSLPAVDAGRAGDGARAAAAAMLAVRFAQGWIFWGGGSRRFIYAPNKLDPHASEWMANKLQSAMPGALLGTDRIIDYLLRHAALLYASMVAFSALELVFGACLILGLLTRLSALTTVGFSLIMMLLFGWQGATCLDEWTMAACNFAMGTSLFVMGSAAYSLDAWLMHRHVPLANSAWFRWLGSGPWRATDLSRAGIAGAVLAAAFIVVTYDHYRGSVVSAFHPAPVSPSDHHFTLSAAAVRSDGGARVTVYLDGGTPDVPATIVRVDLAAADARILETWDSAALAALPDSAYANVYAYNRFSPGYAGITARMGARATIELAPVRAGLVIAGAPLTLTVHDVDGRPFNAAIPAGGALPGAAAAIAAPTPRQERP